MTKGTGKNIRASIGEESSVNVMSKDEKIRMAMGKQKRLDASHYQRMGEYQNKRLFWVNDLDGEVEKWLHLGAELVPRKTKSLKHFKGFTDRGQSEWECVPGVGTDDGGNSIDCYLLFMDADEYQELKINPQLARNKDILNALGMGKADDDARVMSNVKGLKTYAPNLPTGGQGFEQTHDA